MKLVEVAVQQVLHGRNLKRLAHDWIETHQNDIGTIAHHWDNGDHEAAYIYLNKIIKDKNLLYAVMDIMFPETVY